MFKKIKEFFTRSPAPATEASWPFPTARAIDIPIITPEPINAIPVPQPPIVEPKVTKAPPKPVAATKPPKQNTTTKRSPGRPSKKP